jgi:hypothetical protein
MRLAVVLMNAFPCQFNRHRAVLPVLWGKTLFSAFIREDNVHNEIVRVRHVLRFREVSAVDCGFKQVGLNGTGDSTSGQIVIRSVTTTEEIQKLEVVSRSLCNLRKETSLRSFFSDEHGGLALDRSLPKLASNNPPPYNYGVSEEQQSDLPIAVGNTESQGRFISEHADFLREHHKISLLLTKVFVRPIRHPFLDTADYLLNDDPHVDVKIVANRLIFYLGRTASDDFGELLVLAGNGYGIGALKILRGMYERMVTAAFLAKNPTEARSFAEEDVIQKWKLWREHLEIMPDLKDRYTEEQRRAFEERYKAIRAKRKEEECPKCRRPKTQEAWTRITLKDMAKLADPGLAKLYVNCYLEPTFQSHPTSYGWGTRLLETNEGGYTFKDTTPKEATNAVKLGHNLILRLLGFQNKHFELGLEAEIQERIDMFPKVWDRRVL